MNSLIKSTGLQSIIISLINKFISPYVDNLSANDLNLAVIAGDLTLHNLHLKKSAVEKYNLPIEVLEGHVGHLHITIPWYYLRTQPITITIEDVFLLCRMKSESTSSSETAKDDFLKEQEAKQEKLRNAESLDNAAAAGQSAAGEASGDTTTGAGGEKQTWLGALTQKLIDNVQVTVKNIHLRYEDDRSTPEVSQNMQLMGKAVMSMPLFAFASNSLSFPLQHPFAAGFTLSSFRAISTDSDWHEAFIQDSSAQGGVRKLASLDGLSLYFDTDEGSIFREGDGEEGRAWMMEKFKALVSPKLL